MLTKTVGKHHKTQHVKQKAVKRRVPAALLATVVAVCLVIVAGGAAWAYTYNNTKDLSWYLANPAAAEFTISSNGQLHAFSALVNGDALDAENKPMAAVDFAGKVVKLDRGLNLFDLEFTPIGTQEHPFAGTFDGQGFALSRLKISEPATSSDIGLFGFASQTSLITGVNLNQNCSVTVTSDSSSIANVGAIVGNSQGNLSNSSSAATVTLTHTGVEVTDRAFTNIGGVAGAVSGAVSGVSHTGTFKATTPANAYYESSAPDTVITTVAQSVGGVVGWVGGDLSSSHNSGSILVVTSGSGGVDRFGSVVDSKSAGVGGVVGYSTGNVSACTNTGPLLSSANPDAVIADLGKPDESYETHHSDGGGDATGGIVGALRTRALSGMDTSGTDPGLEPGAQTLYVSNCVNTGFVNGLHAVGGIVGAAGTNTVITRCANGIADDTESGHVRSTRWNKAATGGIAGQSFGDISYSRNHAQVENTKTGYYTAGICGMFLKLDAQTTDPEIFACYSTGNIYCGGTTGSPFREGGIVGENNGYVHDNVFLYGTVSSHIAGTRSDDQIAVGRDYGVVMNSTVVYPTRIMADENEGAYIKSGQAVAILNRLAAAGDWQNYYLISPDANNGYPVLNGEAPAASAIDLSLVACTITLEGHAPYTAVYNPVPRLKVSVTVDGEVINLVEGADYRVVADPTALGEDGICTGVTGGEAPYQASIEGIGGYGGSPATTVAYGIIKGDFRECTVVAESATWTGENLNNPKITVIDAGGGIVPADSYDYVINDGNPCVSVHSNYQVRATAKATSNYEGYVRGSYQIISVNLYADTDVIGIYLGTSVWFFDEEKSAIYEVELPLDESGNLPLATDTDALGVERHYPDYTKAVGFATYTAEDGRELTRATPLRTEADGSPVYGDLAIDFTGSAIEPACIGVLYQGELLTGVADANLADVSDVSKIDYTLNYHQFADRTNRQAPFNTNATTSDVRPEASVTIGGRAGGRFSNYVYIDFTINPLTITSDQVLVIQKTTTLPYANGGLPKISEGKYVPGEGIVSDAVEVRYLPDVEAYRPTNPETYRILDGANWAIEFDHATAADDESLEGTTEGFEPGAKAYYRVVATEGSSLKGWGPLSIVDPWVIGAAASGGILMNSDFIEVTFTGTKRLDPTLGFIDQLPPFTVTNTATGEELIRGTHYNVYDRTTSTYSTPPYYDPATGTIRGAVSLVGVRNSGYSTSTNSANMKKVEYTLEKGVLSDAQVSASPSGSAGSWTSWRYHYYGTGATDYVTRFEWRADGWTASELEKVLTLRFTLSDFYTVGLYDTSYTVRGIYQNGERVARATEPGAYELEVALDTQRSLYFDSAESESYRIPVTVVPRQLLGGTQSMELAWPNLACENIAFEPSTYMYTGDYITPTFSVIDLYGNVIDPAYLRLIYPALPAKGQPKEPGVYNEPVYGSTTAGGTVRPHLHPDYYDIWISGDGVHVVTGPEGTKSNNHVTIGADNIDLRIEVVPADISDPAKVKIKVEEAFFDGSAPATPAVSFFGATNDQRLNFVEGQAGDYRLEYRDNNAAGTGTVRVIVVNDEHLISDAGYNAAGGYYYIDVLFTIKGSEIDAQEVSWDYASEIVVEDDGTLSEPGVIGTYEDKPVAQNGYTVVAGTLAGDVFTPKSSGWQAADQVWLKVESSGNGVLSGAAILGPLTAVAKGPGNDFAQLQNAGAVVVTVSDTVFTGSPATPQVTVVKSSMPLIEGRDYAWACADVDAGPATLTVTGRGAYAGAATDSFTITPANLADVAFRIAPQTYTGTQITPGSEVVTSAMLDTYELNAGDWAVKPGGFGANLTVADGGTITLVAAGGNFTGEKQAAFAITPAPLIKENLTIAVDDQPYIGTAVALDASSLSVTDKTSGQPLVFGQDYVISGYASNITPGTATVYLAGAGNYSATANTVTAGFNILPIALSPVMIVGIEASYEHNGSSVRPVPLVRSGNHALPANDYTISYGANDELGTNTGTLTITPTGTNLTGAALVLNFDIVADIAKAQIEAIPNANFEPGGSYEPTLELSFNGIELIEDTHYTVEYADYSIGEKQLTITGIAPYCTGTRVITYNIVGRPLVATMAAAIEEQTYNGSALEPELAISDEGTPLIEGEDFELSYSNNKSATTAVSKATVTVTGIGRYAGIFSLPFDIAAKELPATTLAAPTASGLYVGTGAVKATIAIEDDAITDPVTGAPYRLVEDVDFEAAYTNNNAPGQATVTITGKGNYTFEFVTNYTIKGDLSAAEITPLANQSYAGTPLEPELEVKLGPLTLMPGTDYTVSYATNTAVGTALATLVPAGLYEAAVPVSAAFDIVPRVLDVSMIRGVEGSYEYPGTPLRPEPSVAVGDTTLPATDYTVSYGGNNGLGAGAGTLTVTPSGINLIGDAVALTFNITADISKAQAQAIPDAVFDPGASYAPGLVLTCKGIALVKDVHYTVAYDEYSAGAKTLTVTALAPHVGTKELTYNIAARPLDSSAVISVGATGPWQGSGTVEANIVIEDAARLDAEGRPYRLVEGVDYQVSYANNAAVGTAEVTITGIGNYTFSETRSFEVEAASTPTPDPATVTQHEGTDRQGTAVRASVKAYPEPAEVDTVILAYSYDFPDALAASYLAGTLDAPILLTDTPALDTVTAVELSRLAPSTVYIVGGIGSVSENVERTLKAYDFTSAVIRLGGAGREETAYLIANEAKAKGGVPATAFVANAADFPDALSAGSLSAGQGVPILLTATGGLDSWAQKFLEESGVADVIIVGGPGSVSEEVAGQLRALSPNPAVTRWSGSDRYATSADVLEKAATKWSLSPSVIGLASGMDFPDALVGGAAVGNRGGLLAITDPDLLSPGAVAAIATYADSLTDVEIFGGTGTIRVKDQVQALLR
jgi:putative cell wall-binding protein